MTMPQQPWSPPPGQPHPGQRFTGPPAEQLRPAGPPPPYSPSAGPPSAGGQQFRPPADPAAVRRDPDLTDEDLGRPLSSVGDIIGQITEDLSTLVRQEADLAKAEIKQSATKAGKGTGMFGGAGVAGHMALLFLTIAAWWGIAHLIESFGWAALIVGVLWAIIAAVLAMLGRKEFQQIKGMPKTVDTVQQIPDALKGNEDIR